MKYYAIYDLQIGDYLHTGLNCTTIQDVKDEFISYISVDTDEDDLKICKKMNTHELLDMWGMELQSSKTKFIDEG